MKSLKRIPPLLAATLVLLTACLPSAPAKVARSALARETKPEVPPDDLSALVDGDNTFALNLYGALRTGDREYCLFTLQHFCCPRHDLRGCKWSNPITNGGCFAFYASPGAAAPRFQPARSYPEPGGTTGRQKRASPAARHRQFALGGTDFQLPNNRSSS